MSSRRNKMKEINKELINRAKEIIDLGLKNYPNHPNRMDFITFIRTDRRFLNSIISVIKYCPYFYNSRLDRETKFRACINSEGYFNIVDNDIGEDSSTIDISSWFANLEVIYTIVINDNDMYLTGDMTIRLVNDPDNEVWLYESELSELYE